MAEKEPTLSNSNTSNIDTKQQFKVFRQASIELSKELSDNVDLSLSKNAEHHLDKNSHTDPVINEERIETTFQNMILFLVAVQGLIIILFSLCTSTSYIENFTDVYQMFTGVEIMMFVGFGYLMTFLKRYGMGAVGFTMLITVVGLQWGILTEGFFTHWYAQDWGYLEVDLISFINGLFLVAAILISFGAVIGKVSPLQLMIMTFLEAIFYSINKSVFCLGVVDFFDAGGTINIHMFGAYYGLAVSYMIGKPAASTSTEGGHIADLFSLIGTIFLWIYWPSFNGGTLEVNSHAQQRAILNSVLSLSASTTGAFITSSFLSSNWKIRPVDIQNATLAGGVAIGAVCGMTLRLSDSLLIGLSAGIVSAIGFARIQTLLDDWGLHDTCGIHNLHAMPSVIGGIASVILAGYKGPLKHDYPDIMPHQDQWKEQLAAIAMTLCLSIVSGIFTGYVLKYFTPSSETEFYADAPYWEVMDDYGRSFDKEYEDLEEGIKASKSLRSIVAKFTSLGLDLSNSAHGMSSSWLNSSRHSLNQSFHNIGSSSSSKNTTNGLNHSSSKQSLNNSKHEIDGSKHSLSNSKHNPDNSK